MTVPKRIASAILNSLKGGVVPRVGLPFITVGREAPIRALLHDVDIIADGGASFRFIVGRYGSGKSFLLQTIRNYAMDRNFVVADADLSPERRLHGTKGQGLATYKELMHNLSTKTRPDGGALTLILERWISRLQTEVITEDGLTADSPAFRDAVDKRIFAVVHAVSDMVGGFDFAKLITLYYHAHLDGNDEQKQAVIKWFRGEYANKTEAKLALGIHAVVTDDNWYDHIKLFAAFLKKAGYDGLLILIDELVNIYKIPQSLTRQYNYEKLLTMYNDTLQGRASHLGIIMCGTPQCIEDTRRGVFSYEALRSRLAEGKFASDSLDDLLAPIIRLQPLTYEELLILTEKLAAIHADLFAYPLTVTEADRIDFIRIEFGRIGSDQYITPREVIRDFIELLNILCQHPEVNVCDLLHSGDFAFSKTALEEENDDGAFAEFCI